MVKTNQDEMCKLAKSMQCTYHEVVGLQTKKNIKMEAWTGTDDRGMRPSDARLPKSARSRPAGRMSLLLTLVGQFLDISRAASAPSRAAHVTGGSSPGKARIGPM